MINPTEARKGVGSARLGKDDFVINDIPLTIPPTQIHIEKQSTFHEWQTLRTRSSQLAKSGRGLLYISIDIIFKDLDTLVNLVAGLKAAPFCVIHNEYLEDQLKTVQQVVEAPIRYKQLQPIVLAWTSLNFSTLGHEGYVDCIRGRLEFIYFNYFPYTPIWAYKTGDNDMTPGPVWQSNLWKMFYRPFVLEAKIPDAWPPIAGKPYETILKFKEFVLVPTGSMEGTMATEELLRTLKDRPNEFFSSVNQITNAGFSNSPEFYDRVYLDLVQKKVVSGEFSDDQIRNLTKSGTSITSAGKDLLDKLTGLVLLGSNNAAAAVNQNKTQINSAIAEASKRLKSPGKTELLSAIDVDGTQQWIHLKEHDIEAKVSAKGENKYLGGFQLYQRNRKLTVSAETDMSIEQINVTFRNILAVIPMAGFTYPTCQHIGSIDAEVVFSINASNSATARLNKTYDLIENMNLKFKQVPQGFRTVQIANDFLGLFGLDEFILKNISSTTIPSQPGRSSVVLEARQSGLNSKTYLNGPENLSQEFVVSDDNLRRKVYDIISKYLVEGDPKRDIKKDKDIDGWKLVRWNVSSDGTNEAFIDIVDKCRDAYNNLLTKVHERIFRWNSSLRQGSLDITYESLKGRSFIDIREEGLITYKTLINTSENEYGFIPELNRIKHTIKDRLALVPSKASLNIKPNGRDRVDPSLNLNTITLTEQTKAVELDKIGFNTFQRKIREILDDVIINHLDLPQFRHLKITKDQVGLGRGQMAYPDFASQLASVAAYDSGKVSVNQNELINYDPDTYLWFPAYDGNISSSPENIIDERLLNIAKKHGIDIFNKAQGEVGRFFKEEYLDRLSKSVINKVSGKRKFNPYDELLKNLKSIKSDGEMPPPLYKNALISNSTRGEQIIHTLCPDPFKSSVNWYSKFKEQLQSKEVITHNTNLEDAWGGTDQLPTSNPIKPKSIQSISNTTTKPSGNSKRTTNNEKKLKETQPEFRILLSEVLTELEKKGWQPWISNAARSIAEQKEKIEKGYAPMPKSGVINTTSGHLGGLAADIIEIGKLKDGWNPRLEEMSTAVEFFRDLGSAATSRGLMWGGGGSFIKKTGPKGKNNGWFRYGIGWDPAHIELRKGKGAGKRWVPPDGSTAAIKIDSLSGQSTGKDITSTVSSPLAEATKELALEMYKGAQGQRLVRAYPTFKLYFIEDDSGERKRLAFDDFFSYNAVKSIRVVKSREIAADLCVIELTNISGILSNRKFKHDDYERDPLTNEVISTSDKARDAQGNIVRETKYAMKANTKEENPIASLMLQEGIQISVKMGFSSDPEQLELTFTGQITNVEFSENDELVVITAQTYATELVQDIKGIEPVVKDSPWWDFWGLKDKASTGRILEEMISSPEVLHFGHWESNKVRTPNRELLTDKWQFTPNPADDNIFAPNPETEKKELDGGIFFESLQYVIYKTTIWDICKEMELRHPNFIASPVPYQDQYGDRMTLFFGMPNQLYFARHPKASEQYEQDTLKAKLNEIQRDYTKSDYIPQQSRLINKTISDTLSIKSMVLNVFQKGVNSRTTGVGPLMNGIQEIEKIILKPYKDRMLSAAKRAGYIKPFRKYHLITSEHHIVSNNIQTNIRDIANTIILGYFKSMKVDKEGISGGDRKIKILKLDNALPAEDLRVQTGEFINITSDNLANRYALSMLCQNMKRGYKGDITIIGNPSVKPYDTCFVFDAESDMVGPVDVRQVTHIFTQEQGFLTEIVPDMCVSVADWSLMGTNQAMGIITAGLSNSLYGTIGMGVKDQSKQSYATTGAIVSTLLGSFATDQIINYTQLGFPLIITPLIHHGRPFAGGIPLRKIQCSFWKTAFGKWYNDVDGDFTDWWDDWKEDFVNSLKKYTFQYTEGHFLRGFRGRSFEVE